jgi:hypothetical protein
LKITPALDYVQSLQSSSGMVSANLHSSGDKGMCFLLCLQLVSSLPALFSPFEITHNEAQQRFQERCAWIVTLISE